MNNNNLFVMEFDFPVCDPANLLDVNEQLSGKRLTGVRLEDLEGTLTGYSVYDRCANEKGQELYCFALGHVTVVCEQETDKPKYRFQLDTAVMERDLDISEEDFSVIWSNEHPELIMCGDVTQIPFDEADVYVVAWRERKQMDDNYNESWNLVREEME